MQYTYDNSPVIFLNKKCKNRATIYAMLDHLNYRSEFITHSFTLSENIFNDTKLQVIPNMVAQALKNGDFKFK